MFQLMEYTLVPLKYLNMELLVLVVHWYLE